MYITYYVCDVFLTVYIKAQDKKKLKVQKQSERVAAISEKKKAQENDQVEIKSKHAPVNSETGEKLREILKRVQVNISRWYLDSARSLIIEWLALNKHDKDLNLLLADVYEREKKYQNAEYIYRDLLDENPDDDYVLQRLWNVYSLRGKFKKSYECYKEALRAERSNTEILDILTHLSLELWNYKNAQKYASLYLKEKPRNAEKISIKWYALEMLGKEKEAIKCYRQVLDIQPYNSEVIDRVSALEEVKT